MLAADVEQLLWSRGVRSEAQLRLARLGPDDDTSSLASTVAATGTDILRNLERLFRHEICPHLG